MLTRRGLLTALGLAPVLAKLGWPKAAPVAPPTPAAPFAFGPPTFHGIPFTYTASLDSAQLYGDFTTYTPPRFYAINVKCLSPRIRWKLKDRQRRIAARALAPLQSSS